MGAACCVATKSSTIMDGPPGGILQRHVRYSPSWSFRCDNRGRVAGEVLPADWLRDGGGANNLMGAKPNAPVQVGLTSEEGSSVDSFRTPAWQKSSVSEGISEVLRFPSSDQAVSRNLVQVKESIESPSVSCSPPIKPSASAPSVTSLTSSPLSSQSNLVPSNLTTSKLHPHNPGYRLLRQVSDSGIPEYKSQTHSISEDGSSFLPPAWSNDSTRGSNSGSSDSWSLPSFSDHMINGKKRWSFDNEASGLCRDKISRSFGYLGSPFFDLHTCGVCMNVLSEVSSLRWSSHMPSNELAVVSVLTCGHAYHAECLENLTPEFKKFDPECPVCVLGEKYLAKMSGKALKADHDSKPRRRLRKHFVNSNIDSNILFDHPKSCEVEGMSSSLSMKSSHRKPFLRRHFSFGLKASRLTAENQSTQRKVISLGRCSLD